MPLPLSARATDAESLGQKFADDASGPAAAPDTRGDLLSALANLGYPRPAAEKAVDKVLGAASDRPFETLLREALKALVR